MKYQKILAIVMVVTAILLTPGCIGTDKGPAATATQQDDSAKAAATQAITDQQVSTDRPEIAQATYPAEAVDISAGTIAPGMNVSTGCTDIDPSLASISDEASDDGLEQEIPTPDPGIIG
ncbi:MAG TPA: hypothetical protein VK436_02930 [Methanocella sp.]|nr:hypothetical protein [Methanocella sp.]